MKFRLHFAIIASAVAAVVLSIIAPDATASVVLRALVSGLVLFGVWTALVRLHPRRSAVARLTSWDPWLLLSAALVLRTVAGSFPVGAVDGVMAIVDIALGGGVLALTGVALHQMMRQRFGDRSTDNLMEAAIAAGTVALVNWVTLIEPLLHIAGRPVSDGLDGIFSISAALVMATTILFLRWSFPTRPASLTMLAFSQVIAVLIAQLQFIGSIGGSAEALAIATALGPVLAAGIGLGALDATINIYEEPSGPAGARLGRIRLVALIIPVVLGPLLLTLCLTGALSLSPLAVAAFSIVLSLLVVGHLLAMVQARASSTHWASHDKLTGLPNRALFRERTALALERSRKMGYAVAVLYLDLDRFKHVNDSMGHEAGDQLLEQVARRIVACVDAGDTVARLGGDEFAILLPEVYDEAVPRKLARRLLKNFSAPFNLKPRPVFMSPSIGIALSEGGISLETLLTHADTAMYRAKECGRNNFAAWSQDMNEAARQRLMLETHLHSAIANNELRLAYQPKVDLKSGSVAGVEALIRWHHPKLGVISPGAFIHLAEESGLINQIGEWVLHEACRQGRLWFENGFDKLSIAVNLSSRQFQQPGLADLVAGILRTTGFPGELLELELTESMAMDGGNSTLETLSDLRQMGVKFSIDDFGTGYSNLSYLSSFPLEAIKIDKSFIQQIDKSDGDAALVVAIIAMGHGLGMRVIGEGVETPEQVNFLVEQGCDEMQGFLFSRPLPPKEVESLLMLEHVSGGNGRLGLGTQQGASAPRTAPQPRRLEREIPAREQLPPPAAANPAPEAIPSAAQRVPAGASRGAAPSPAPAPTRNAVPNAAPVTARPPAQPATRPAAATPVPPRPAGAGVTPAPSAAGPTPARPLPAVDEELPPGYVSRHARPKP